MEYLEESGGRYLGMWVHVGTSALDVMSTTGVGYLGNCRGGMVE